MLRPPLPACIPWTRLPAEGTVTKLALDVGDASVAIEAALVFSLVRVVDIVLSLSLSLCFLPLSLATSTDRDCSGTRLAGGLGSGEGATLLLFLPELFFGDWSRSGDVNALFLRAREGLTPAVTGLTGGNLPHSLDPLRDDVWPSMVGTRLPAPGRAIELAGDDCSDGTGRSAFC